MIEKELEGVSIKLTDLGLNGEEKTKAQLKAERKAIHEEKMAAQSKEQTEGNKSKAEMKAERRAIQEAQRMAKEVPKNKLQASQPTNQPTNQQTNQPTTQLTTQPTNTPTNQQTNQPTNQPTTQLTTQPTNTPSNTTKTTKERMQPSTSSSTKNVTIKNKKNSYLDPKKQVAFFKHLYIPKTSVSSFTSNIRFTHTAVRNTLTPNDRVLSLCQAIEQLLEHYETPPRKSMLRDLAIVLKKHFDHLQKVRPMCISMWNFIDHLACYISKLNPASGSPDDDDATLKKQIIQHLDDYMTNIRRAGEEIVEELQNRIQDGDVVMVFGFSSLLVEAFKQRREKGTTFEVVVVDGRPKLHGITMVERLRQEGIACTYSLVSAVSFYIRQVSKVVIDAHSVFSNGSVLAPVGTSLLCLHAKLHDLPVLVICESYKLSERCLTDSIVYNELGDPQELNNHRQNTLQRSTTTNESDEEAALCLNVTYDVIPDDLVDLVITEKGTLPSSSVSGIVRMKWAGAYA